MLGDTGRQAKTFPAHLPPPRADAIFLTGPFGSMAPLGLSLEATEPEQRPLLVWFLTEQLPDPRIPLPLLVRLGRLRSRYERRAHDRRPDGTWQIRPIPARLARFGHRFRYTGDLEWFRDAGLLDLLVTGSPWRGARLRALGHDPMVVPSPSFYPGWGAALNLERDVPVLWIGKAGSRRRLRLLNRLEADLGRSGIPLLRIDGVRRPYVFGEERTKLLNRTKIIVNLLRAPWDNNAMRFALAAQNGALLVSEPTLPHTSFVPGTHYIEAQPGAMAETISALLEDDAARSRITAAAGVKIRDHSKQETYAGICAQLERRIGTGRETKAIPPS